VNSGDDDLLELFDLFELHQRTARTMRITSAAMSFISLPSPKGNPFREGPTKDKRKSRSFSKVLSPIRRMGKHISKRANRNSAKRNTQKRSPKKIQLRDEEQGWIAPSTTYETEDTLSPRSFDSLTTTGRTSLLARSGRKEEEVLFCSLYDLSQHINDHDDEYLDLEAGFNESATASTIFRTEDNVQDNTNEIEYIGDIPENYETQNAAPQVVTESKNDSKNKNEEEIGIEYPSIQDLDQDRMASKQEETRHSTESLLVRIDTTEVIDETNEIDSLAPAADISFFLNEEDGADFNCVGHLSTPQNEQLPVEINVDSIDDLSNNSFAEEENQVLYIEDDDEISISSYNSYLQAIECITASASRKVKRAISVAMDELEIETPSYTPLKVVGEQELDLDFYDEEDYCRISFNPSRELLLQAMEGASAKAKADIERATALALSKMNSASSESSKRKKGNTPNRVLGFIFFLLLIFQFGGNSFQLLRGMKPFSHALGIDEFQVLARNDILMEPHLERGMWGDNKMVAREYETQVALNNRRFYNIGCTNKIACLALGNI
jgi:hypothetical protein